MSAHLYGGRLANTMPQGTEIILLSLAEVRSLGHISAAAQLQLIGIDLNPCYVQRECILFLDEEEGKDEVPHNTKEMIDWANKILAESKK